MPCLQCLSVLLVSPEGPWYLETLMSFDSHPAVTRGVCVGGCGGVGNGLPAGHLWTLSIIAAAA